MQIEIKTKNVEATNAELDKLKAELSDLSEQVAAVRRYLEPRLYHTMLASRLGPAARRRNAADDFAVHALARLSTLRDQLADAAVAVDGLVVHLDRAGSATNWLTR